MTDDGTTSEKKKSETTSDSHKSELTSTQFSQLVRDHQNAYIRVADNKASILLSGLIAYLGLSLSAIGANVGSEGSIFLIIAAGSILSSLVAIYFAASAVYPNTPTTPQGLIMWESIIEKGEQGYRESIQGNSSEELLEELIDENYQLAKVNDTKYRQVRCALLATIPTVASGILAMMFLVIS
jgi:hypothetical protein